MTIITTPNGIVCDHLRNFQNAHCIYQHSVFDDTTQLDTVIYIGTCRLHELYIATDARRNTAWRERVNDATVLTVQLLAIGTRQECANERGRMIQAMNPRPICNAVGIDVMGMVTNIVCNETGQEFRTQLECAQIMGIAQGRLSGHLRGLPGHNKCNGYTFRRGK